VTSNHFKKLKIHLRSNIILLQYLLVHILHYIRSFWNDHVFGTLQVIIHPRYLKIIWKICCSLHAFLRPRANKNSKIRWSNHQAITLITNHSSPLKNMLIFNAPLWELSNCKRRESNELWQINHRYYLHYILQLYCDKLVSAYEIIQVTEMGI
jgi:hypothetical protein